MADPPVQADLTFHVRQRERMVETYLRDRGILDERVLQAFREVPRHCFVPAASQAEAYADCPVPIGWGQTVSQPYVVAFMLQELGLRPSDRVLEVGTGSGYQTALLARLCGQVFSVEIIPELAAQARRVLAALGYGRVALRTGDGTAGWAESAPFDAIVASAAAAEVPPDLVWQLTAAGRLILPLGRSRQQLVLVRRTPAGTSCTPLLFVRFVPMRGGAA